MQHYRCDWVNYSAYGCQRLLRTLVRSGKVRYVGCSNYSGWQLMKALGVSERLGLQRYVSQQIHYTLQAREAEHELVPLAIDQECSILMWSPLAGGLLSGKYRRDQDDSEGRHVSASEVSAIEIKASRGFLY